MTPDMLMTAATSTWLIVAPHAACPFNLLLSKLSPAFHTAKVIAAILRAIVTRASSGRSPRASNSAYHVLKGSHREAVSAAPLKTYFSVRL